MDDFLNPKKNTKIKRDGKSIKFDLRNSLFSKYILRYIKFDFFIPIIFILSMFNALRAATSQYYLIGYADDISWVHWASEHIGNPISLLSHGPGYGYRPGYNLIYGIGYWLWGSNEFYYYLLNGILFAGAMIFLYKLIELISDRMSGIIAVLLFMFLDASFILVWKMNYLSSIGELFFIASSLYYSINYFEKLDRKSLVLAVILALLAFGTKEQSIIIIPLVNIIYMLHKKFSTRFKATAILLCLSPIIFYFFMIFFFSTEVSISRSSSLIDLIKSRLSIYFEWEMLGQLKNPYILVLGCIGAFYFHNFKKEKYGKISIKLIKNVVSIFIILSTYLLIKEANLYSLTGSIFIISLLTIGFIYGDKNQRFGLVWFSAGFAPLLIVSLGPEQPTYLAEPNMGLVLFIGVTLSMFIRHFFFPVKEQKPETDTFIKVLRIANASIVILIIILQIAAVPDQIRNTNNYQKMRADSETSFKESVDYLKVTVPENGKIYYIPQEMRTKVGGEQITSETMQDLLCIKGRCDIEVELLSTLDINSSSNHKGEFIYLPSNLDIYIFFNEYKFLLRDDIYNSQKRIKNAEYEAMILGLV